jgi:2-keto-3-deoxy-L-rhamnonate aldolase RhmA
MREGGLAIVSHVGFADPAVIEIIAMAGFDGAFIDMEHTVFDLELVGEMIRVAEMSGITPIVRVPDNDAKLILRLLDAGAQGIQVPHIEGLEGAKRAVNAVCYPPAGPTRRRWHNPRCRLWLSALERACTEFEPGDFTDGHDRGSKRARRH